MAKFDEQLSRMEFLMGYNMPKNNAPSKVEYMTEGADGKVYGILKEGAKYYIMTTEKGKEKLAESYQYIGGFNRRNENAFKSYNEATKMLEQKMIVLNESLGIHKDVSTVDFNRGEKLLESLTKEARTELNRVKMIMENSMKVGGPVGDGKPFEKEAEAKLDKDLKEAEDDPTKANEGFTDASKDVEKELTTGKPVDKDDAEEGFEKAKSDLEGVAVAAEEPKGGKAVMVNEDMTFPEPIVDTPLEDFEEDVPYEDADSEEEIEIEVTPDNPNDTQDLVGFGDEEDEDFDTLMEEFKEKIESSEEALTGPHGELDVQSVECVKDGCCCKAEETEEALVGPKGDGKTIAAERLNEAQLKKADEIATKVVDKLLENRKMNVEQALRSVLKENELHVWGDHPSYQKQPMTTPPNTDVKKGTADKDWDDESAKTDTPYGEKIGDGKPFDQVVNILTDSVMAVLKEAMTVKKN